MKKYLLIPALTAGAVATTVIVKPIGDLRDSDQVVTDVSSLVSSVTNLEGIVTNLPNTLATSYRKIGDDQAYAVKSVGAISHWECSREDLAEALKGIQPDYYEYGDGYVEYYLGFYVGEDWWYGWAYSSSDATELWFTLYHEWYNEDYGYWDYEYVDVKAIRGVAEYDIDHPIGRFALKSEVDNSVNAVRDGVNNLTGLLTSETKLWRSGGPNECGTGWGYMQHNLTNDLRRWRIRAPKITPANDTLPLNPDSPVTPSYSLTYPSPSDIPVIKLKFQEYHYGQTTPHWETEELSNYITTRVPSGNLLCFYDRYSWTLTPYNTRGVYGSDAVTHVDYRFDLIGYGIVFNAVQTNSTDSTKPIYRINVDLPLMNMPFVTNGITVYVKLPFDPAQTNTIHISPNPVSSRAIRQYASTLSSNTVKEVVYTAYKIHDENENRCTLTYDTLAGPSTFTVKNVYAHLYNLDKYGNHTPAYTSSAGGLHFPLFYDFEVYTPYAHTSLVDRVDASIPDDYYETSGVYTQKYYKVSRTISFDCPSSTTLYDTFSPAYRLMGTYDSNLFYDAALDCTFRIVSSNGCFYTEVHHAGDWREKAWR